MKTFTLCSDDCAPLDGTVHTLLNIHQALTVNRKHLLGTGLGSGVSSSILLHTFYINILDKATVL